MSTLKVDALRHPSSSADNIVLNSNGTIAATMASSTPAPISKVASVIQSSDFTLPTGTNTFVIAGNGNMTRTVTAQSNDTYIWVQYELKFTTNTSTSNTQNRAIYKVSLYKNGVFDQDILPEEFTVITSNSFVTKQANMLFVQTSFSANDSLEVRVLHRSYNTGSSRRGVIKAGSYLNVFCIDVN